MVASVTKRSLVHALLVAEVAVAAVACERRDPSRPAQTTTTSATIPRSEAIETARGGGPPIEASYRIAQARCDRETACNRVGGGRRWATQVSCVADQRERVRSDFASLECARGIDSVQLGLCLNAMRLRPCGEVGPELERVSECRPTALCSP